MLIRHARPSGLGGDNSGLKWHLLRALRMLLRRGACARKGDGYYKVSQVIHKKSRPSRARIMRPNLRASISISPLNPALQDFYRVICRSTSRKCTLCHIQEFVPPMFLDLDSRRTLELFFSWTLSTLEGGRCIMLPALYKLSSLRFWLARNAHWLLCHFGLY